MKTKQLIFAGIVVLTVFFFGCDPNTNNNEQCQSLEFCEKPVTFCIDGENEYYTYNGINYDNEDSVAQAIGGGCQIAGLPDYQDKILEIKAKLVSLKESVLLNK